MLYFSLMLEGIFLVFQLGFAVLLFYMCLSFVIGAPFVPSTKSVANEMVTLAHIKPGDTIYDLGSGDGRILFLAAALGANAWGYEINPYLVLYTNIRRMFSPHRQQVLVRWKNFWGADIRDADVVFVYLIPWHMKRLEKQLSVMLKPGSLVVSNSFIFPNWKIIRKDSDHHVYVFQMR